MVNIPSFRCIPPFPHNFIYTDPLVGKVTQWLRITTAEYLVLWEKYILFAISKTDFNITTTYTYSSTVIIIIIRLVNLWFEHQLLSVDEKGHFIFYLGVFVVAFALPNSDSLQE